MSEVVCLVALVMFDKDAQVGAMDSKTVFQIIIAIKITDVLRSTKL